MNDPIEYALRIVGHMIMAIPDALKPFLFIVMMFGMVLFFCMFKKNFLGSDEQKEEKQWSDICGALLDRLSYLLPIYEQTLTAMATEYANALGTNKQLSQLARSMSSDMKERAEFDFCVHDAQKDENVAMLQEQLEMLLEKGGRNG